MCLRNKRKRSQTFSECPMWKQGRKKEDIFFNELMNNIVTQ